jgi:Bacteriophage replication protein O
LSKASELIPNSFQVPNLLVDRLLPFLSGPQTKVVLLVCRKTFGWGKRVDLISLGQFQQQAGLSRSSVYEALETFVRAGLLLKTSRGRQQVNEWSLNLEANADDVIRFLEESSKAVKRPIYIAPRTSSPSELVLTANQNYIAQRTHRNPRNP